MTHLWESFKVCKKTKGIFSNNNCQQLERVFHVAHLTNATRIVEDGRIKQGLIYDKSKLNKDRILVCWLSPNIWYWGSRYGNISFEFEFSTLVQDKLYYWVESIERYNPTACRILITDKNYDEILEPYDPNKDKGPWIFDNLEGKHFWNGEYCLEFMFEQDLLLADAIEIDYVKHNDQYCNLGFTECWDRLQSEKLINARFISYILSHDVSINAALLTKEKRHGISPLNSLYDALSEITQLLFPQGKRKIHWGTVTSEDPVALSIVKSALHQLFLGDKNSFRQLCTLFKNPEEFTWTLKGMVSERFGVSDESLLYLDE